MAKLITVTRRLFLTADRSRLVDPDDPEAAFLWATPGDEVTEAEAQRVGYVLGDAPADDDPADGDEPADEGEPAEPDPEAEKAEDAGEPEAEKVEAPKPRTRKGTSKRGG